MAASETEICNQALLHLANTKTITNLDTDKSTEAKVCRTFYAQVRDEVLREFAWPFAKRFAPLALVATDPVEGWPFSYRLPSDALAVRLLPNGFSRVATAATRERYVLASDASGGLIYADAVSPMLEYTARIEDVAQYPPDFVKALALKLAGDIAPAVTGGDEFKLGIRALQRYEMEIDRAKVNALNEDQPDQPPEAELVTVRG